MGSRLLLMLMLLQAGEYHLWVPFAARASPHTGTASPLPSAFPASQQAPRWGLAN